MLARTFVTMLHRGAIFCLLLLIEKAVCQTEQTCLECQTTEVCYGGDTGLTLTDANCIIQNRCDVLYRADACNVCVINAIRTESEFKACDNKCYIGASRETMPQLDVCRVCGGVGDTCNPVVQAATPDLWPSNTAAVLELTGLSFSTPEMQVVVLEPGPPRRVLHSGTIATVASSTKMTAEIPGLAKGSYLIGARTGRTGKEYETSPCAEIDIYDAADFTVDTISPERFTLGLSEMTELAVTLGVTTQKDLTQYDALACLVGTNRGNAELTVSASGGSVECAVTIPAVSMAYNVCLSLIGVHHVGCMELPFYAQAPEVTLNNSIKFSPRADRLLLTFAVAVVTRDSTDCAEYFEDITALGTGPTCTWSTDQTRLDVLIGEGATIGPDSTLTLKPGLKRANVPYSLETAALTLQTLTTDVMPIAISPRTAWPVELTAFAKNPQVLGIVVTFSPGSRPPVTVTWTVNDVIQETASGKLDLHLAISAVGVYRVTVTVTDVFGGKAELAQTITKKDTMLPHVGFTPMYGLRVKPDSSFVTRPNIKYVIGTRVDMVETTFVGLQDFTFSWQIGGVQIGSGFTFRIDKPLGTDFCGESVTYLLVVYKTSEPEQFTSHSITVHVECREPVAAITGSGRVEVPLSPVYRIEIDGETLSHDPDGGKLTYAWTCEFVKYNNERDCMTSMSLRSQASSPWLRFSNAKLAANVDHAHTFTLRVSVVKNGMMYNSTTTVVYLPKSEAVPMVRWVTLKHKYRYNVPITVKAYVGLKTDVHWRFVPEKAEYSWIDLSIPEVKKEQGMSAGFAWVTIEPEALQPGQRYLLEAKVTNTSTSEVARSTFDLHIYHRLRLCTVHANDVTEMEETTLSLQGCSSDEHSRALELSCMLEDREPTLNTEMTILVPKFRNRQTNKARFNCKVRDTLGHVMQIESNEVGVSLRMDIDIKIQERVDMLRKEGKTADAVELMSDELEDLSDDMKEDRQNKIVDDIKHVIQNKPTAREIKRTLMSVNKLDMASVKKPEVTRSLAGHMQALLKALCGEDDEGMIDGLTNKDIKGLISRAEAMTRKERSTTKAYREIQDMIACIKIKRLAVDDHDDIDLDDTDAQGGTGSRSDKKSRVYYAVSSLENVRDKGMDVDFPEEIYTKYREQWGCQGEVQCNGVGIKVEYHQLDPPDIPTGRKDVECSHYVYVDLYNPATGALLTVNELKQPISIDVGSTCPQAICWFYEKATDSFEQSGVTTATRGDVTVCQTNHLSCFTMQSEHVGESGTNLVMILGLSLGIVLLVVSTVILVRAFCLARKKSKKHAEEKDADYSVGYERQM